MFSIFKNSGILDEVVIPPRTNKRGNMYGFVRFRNVEDVRMMVVVLDNIYIQGCNFFSNTPCFKRNGIHYKKGFELGKT